MLLISNAPYFPFTKKILIYCTCYWCSLPKRDSLQYITVFHAQWKCNIKGFKRYRVEKAEKQNEESYRKSNLLNLFAPKASNRTALNVYRKNNFPFWQNIELIGEDPNENVCGNGYFFYVAEDN
jgi:hypothetical protein